MSFRAVSIMDLEWAEREPNELALLFVVADQQLRILESPPDSRNEAFNRDMADLRATMEIGPGRRFAEARDCRVHFQTKYGSVWRFPNAFKVLLKNKPH